jgi:structural maintenance of chromosomes protein 5
VQAELEDAEANWLPQLESKMQQVSQAFSENFARIGSVGEVALHKEGEKYEAYAIHIKVKFRNEGALEVRPPLCFCC